MQVHSYENLNSGTEFAIAIRALTESLIHTPREFSCLFGAGDGPAVSLEWAAPTPTAGAARISVGGKEAAIAFCLTGLDSKLDAATMLSAKRISADVSKKMDSQPSGDMDAVKDRPLLAIL